jgi:putative Holliday junction resolvase
MAVTGPVLAVDFGTVRLGLAVSDADGDFAFPIDALESRGRKRDLQALAELIEERGVKQLVVGLPIHLDGRSGETTEAARNFARELGKKTGLAPELLDERWTSLEAERALREGAPSKRRKKGAVDSAAAAILLRTFLAREASSAARAGEASAAARDGEEA